MIAVFAIYAHFDLYKIPTKRIDLNEVYAEMPEDSFHHYINLPVDHGNPGSGLFRAFYQFSPHFYESRNITFLLTDGQMELVSTDTDFDFFENVIPHESYVLIGVRGHAPTLFPEVYKNGKIDYQMATMLFNSDQQIEDIEMVRLDLIKKGILNDNDKINIFGASGAGVLAQQYISKYGGHVKRVILESTGAPDLSRKYNLRYSPDFKEFNSEGARILEEILRDRSFDKKFLCNVLYQTGRTAKHPKKAQLQELNKLRDGGNLLSYRFRPSMNLSILGYIIQSPGEIAARVRWFELIGKDLLTYNSKNETNLLSELSEEAISDVLQYYRKNNIPARDFEINRSSFTGEVLILKGREDVVFSDEISEKIQESYSNSKLLLFDDGHRMQNDVGTYQKIRKAFLADGLQSDFLHQ